MEEQGQEAAAHPAGGQEVAAVPAGTPTQAGRSDAPRRDRWLWHVCLVAFLLWLWLVAGFRFIVPKFESEIYPFVKIDLPWPTQFVLYLSTPYPLMALAAAGFGVITLAVWLNSRKIALGLAILALVMIPLSFASLHLPYAQPMEVQRPP